MATILIGCRCDIRCMVRVSGRSKRASSGGMTQAGEIAGVSGLSGDARSCAHTAGAAASRNAAAAELRGQELRANGVGRRA